MCKLLISVLSAFAGSDAGTSICCMANRKCQYVSGKLCPTHDAYLFAPFETDCGNAIVFSIMECWAVITKPPGNVVPALNEAHLELRKMGNMPP